MALTLVRLISVSGAASIKGCIKGIAVGGSCCGTLATVALMRSLLADLMTRIKAGKCVSKPDTKAPCVTSEIISPTKKACVQQAFT
jgi:hypothetical protein